MKKFRPRCLVALLLVALMLGGSLTPVLADDATTSPDATTAAQTLTATDATVVDTSATDNTAPGVGAGGTTLGDGSSLGSLDVNAGIREVQEILAAPQYTDYSAQFTDQPLVTSTVTVNGGDYDAANTTGDVTVQQNYMGSTGSTAITPDTGTISYNFTVPTTGMYMINLNYYPVPGKVSDIERILRIDGALPFKEAYYIVFKKNFTMDLTPDADGNLAFLQDSLGNDLNPQMVESPQWSSAYISDSSAFYNAPFEFYLTAGAHSISFESVRESLGINSITFGQENPVPTYADYITQHDAAGAKDIDPSQEPVKIQAEFPTAVSDASITPLFDKSSAITEPQDPTRLRLNTIGRDRWQTGGQWIRWTIDVPADGYYSIVPRFKQSIYQGIYVSRELTIDGTVPFQEASYLQFNYSTNWQTAPLNNGTTNFKFYLTKGSHDLQMNVVLGDMASIINEAQICLLQLNDIYQRIVQITGPPGTANADEDYNFAVTIPDVIVNINQQSTVMLDIADQLQKIIGTSGYDVALLTNLGVLLRQMGANTDRITPNLQRLSDQKDSLAQWIGDRRNQPLEVDYIVAQSPEAKLPTANENFFVAFGYQMQSFFLSFFTDYTSIGTSGDITPVNSSPVQVWLFTGRDQALILRQLMDVTFVQQNNISVNLKLVDGGTLLPATLAGVGPDVALGMAGGDVINYAIRSAAVPLNGFDTYNDVIQRFDPSAMASVTLQDDRQDPSQWQVFGLPETQSFTMMYYRKDVFANLGLWVPQTWDDVYALIPVLQLNQMQIGLLPGTGSVQMFMYQEQMPFYKGDGYATNLDTNTGIASFKKMTDFYQLYKFPTVYDVTGYNRFRSGMMPLVFADNVGAYNLMSVSMPELRGMWGFVPLPGTIRAKQAGDDAKGFIDLGNGQVVDNTSPSSVSACVMITSARNRGEQAMEMAWKFMDWWTSDAAQSAYGNQMITVLGPSGRYNTANVSALDSQPWPAQDYAALKAQFAHLTGTPNVPGSYIVDRYVQYAWQAVYNNNVNPVDAILDNNIFINRELARKRTEFGMPTPTVTGVIQDETTALVGQDSGVGSTSGLPAPTS
ncbi:MAG: extracellular solute-binding protein [Micrococcales bacterium]|nr:extracellular solute-binding protein [Micrococcales bacterium]